MQWCIHDLTCPSSGDEHLNPACNCCFASTGCTIYKADGTPICTATWNMGVMWMSIHIQKNITLLKFNKHVVICVTKKL